MKRLLVIGDSWAASFVDGRGDTGILYKELEVPWDCQQAVSGSTASSWAADTCGRLTRALTTLCDAVLVSLSGNDAFEILSDGRVTPEEVVHAASSLSSVLHKLVQAHSCVYVMLYSNPYPMNARTEAGCKLLNLVIKSVVPPEVTVLPTQSCLSAEDMPGRGIHPAESGYMKIAQMLRKEIMQ